MPNKTISNKQRKVFKSYGYDPDGKQLTKDLLTASLSSGAFVGAVFYSLTHPNSHEIIIVGFGYIMQIIHNIF